MQRLVPRAAARNQRDLALLQRSAANEFALGAKKQDVCMGCRETVQTFFEYCIGAVDQLFHERPPVWSLVQINGSTHTFGIARELRGEVHDQLFERTVLLVVAEVGYGHRDNAGARLAVRCAQPAGM